MKVVIVESPAKAKTINKYLGKDYIVLASFGHVRDLPAKDGSVKPDEDFDMTWELPSKSEQHMKEIVKALKDADTLILATDPDREGEAISWHVLDVLHERNKLKRVAIKRVVFHEITKKAIQAAMEEPRDLDAGLIDAYLARRAMDYLVGFTLSPVLWRKLPGSRSAGRVQSVALRLICDREREIELFNAQEYWTVGGAFKSDTAPFSAHLTHLDGKKLMKFSLGTESDAKHAEETAKNATYTVGTVEKKQAKRHPAPPFITSTLQQEAARKLHFSARRTMQVAQRLYEGIDLGGETVGLITYMRTDSVQMAGEAIGSARRLIPSLFGDKYLPEKPRVYKTKARNAQEAHEAIRPTDFFRKPDDIGRYLDDDQRKLYALIYKRALASQMESAVLDQVGADLIAHNKKAVFRATGSVIAFDGFLKLYKEGIDDAEDPDDQNRVLPPLKEGDRPELTKVSIDQHFTQPPPRFTEASLVRKLEELGIGRPSTYASIIAVLQDRNYVRLEKRRFTPEDRGRIVTAFLENYFTQYVEYSFTANLEDELDKVAEGKINWKALLADFWKDFSSAVEDTAPLRVSEVLDVLNEKLASHFFGEKEDGTDPRKCPACDDGILSLKLGKFGAFIGCSNYPECRHTRPLMEDSAEGETGAASNEPRQLGTDPETGKEVTLKKGPYGFYVQLGEPEGKTKPKRAALPKTTQPEAVDLEIALSLLALPRDVGKHPDTGKMITANIGRFGPYVHHEKTYKNLSGDDNVLTVTLERAVALLAEAKKKDTGKELGAHPEDGNPVTLLKGRYGPYVKHGKTNASLPKALQDKEEITLEEAVTLLAEKVAKGGGKKKKKAAAKKAKKAPAKKAKKASAKKASKAKKATAKKASKAKKA